MGKSTISMAIFYVAFCMFTRPGIVKSMATRPFLQDIPSRSCLLVSSRPPTRKIAVSLRSNGAHAPWLRPFLASDIRFSPVENGGKHPIRVLTILLVMQDCFQYIYIYIHGKCLGFAPNRNLC